jgi:hypothetical protein
MKKRKKRLVGVVAFALGALGAAGAVLMRRKGLPGLRQKRIKEVASVWARPGMTVTFRAELMPGRDPSERTYQIVELLPSGRVLLSGITGEHTEKEFEAIR